MPKMIIVAGPNGAGKTSFAREYLAGNRRSYTYISADEIARLLRTSDADHPGVDVAAAREMLKQIDAGITRRKDLMIETTLATLHYARRIPAWRDQGYSTALIYLRITSPEYALERVRRRVSAGGHDIPEHVIRRRFDRSWRYFESIYRSLVDEWYVWDSVEGSFLPVAAWDMP